MLARSLYLSPVACRRVCAVSPDKLMWSHPTAADHSETLNLASMIMSSDQLCEVVSDSFYSSVPHRREPPQAHQSEI